LRLARSREAPVSASIHKKVIVAGFGCAGVLVALIVVAFLVGPRPEFDAPSDPALYAPDLAAAAADSLHELRARFVAPRSGEATGRDGDLWKVALAAIRSERWEAGVRALPYGDTFPVGAAQRDDWLAAARWTAVGVALGSHEAAHARGSDPVTQSFRTDANLLLSVTRALHARARRSLEPPSRPAAAAAAERAALAIGRGLESEPDVEHALLGARVVHDALRFLTTAPALAARVGVSRPADALAQADSDVADFRAVRRLMGVAGALADNCTELAAWARDQRLAVAARREAVRSIAYGWVFNRLEPVYGLNGERGRRLAELAGLDLPPPVAAAVREGQAVVRLGVAQRFARSLEYRGWRDASAGF